MSKASDAARRSVGDSWEIVIVPEQCSLCEGCVRHCPTAALTAERVGDRLRLHFDASLCSGCALGQGCEAICPESALERIPSEVPAGDAKPVLLIDGALLQCSYCGTLFGPLNKLETVSRKGRGKVERELCPLCRRTQLVVRFIDEKRSPTPESKAEYRSTKDILRRAGHYHAGPRRRHD